MGARAVLGVMVAAAVTVGAISYVHAEAFDCRQAAIDKCKKVHEHDTNACQTGRGPCKVFCCEKPPCQYRYQLIMWTMLEHLMFDDRVQACAAADKQSNGD